MPLKRCMAAERSFRTRVMRVRIYWAERPSPYSDAASFARLGRAMPHLTGPALFAQNRIRGVEQTDACETPLA
jgi:hypothetical protein